MAPIDDISASGATWLLGGARLSAFLAPSVTLEPQIDWWTEVVGYSPETTIQQNNGEQIYSGMVGDAALTLSRHPFRIEWQFTTPIPEGELTQLPTLGSTVDVIPIFERLMTKWLRASAPSCVRIAFGANLLQPVTDLWSGYQILSHYIPVAVMPDSSDLLYQINRPRIAQTGLPGLKLNRLTQWSVMQAVQTLRSPAVSPGAARVIKLNACRLDLDINTDAEFSGELSPAVCSELFVELVRLGEEIAVEGDKP